MSMKERIFWLEFGFFFNLLLQPEACLNVGMQYKATIGGE